MGNFVKVANTSDVPEGQCGAFDVQGKSIAIFNVEGSYYAIDNTCHHRGGPLGEGDLDGKNVTCPWHGWEYDVTTGACLTSPTARQAQYKIKVEGNDLLVEL